MMRNSRQAFDADTVRIEVAMMGEMPQGHEEFACATFRMRMCDPQPIRLASLLKR